MELPKVDRALILAHLTALFDQGCEEHGYSYSIFTLPSSRTRFFASVCEEAVDYCAREAESGQDVYCGVGMFKTPPASGRGSSADVVALGAFFADIDILNPAAHKGKLYPASEADALRVAVAGIHEPTMVVHSGNGLHAYWQLSEPWTFETPEQNNDAGIVVSRFGATMQANAKSIGRVVDPIKDLARILRVAGTLNHKSNPPKPVRLLSSNDKVRYRYDDIEPMLVAAEFVRQGPELMGQVASFVLNPDATVSSKMISLMRSQSPEMAEVWDKKRDDFADQSPSSYDLALANMLVAADMNDQDIVDIMVHWRREVAKKPKNRVDYYQRTIGKARAARSAKQAVAVFSTPGEMPSTSTPQLLTSDDRDKLRNAVRAALGIDVVQFVQLNLDKAEYFLVLGNGEEFSVGGVRNITNFGAFRDRILERCNVLIPVEISKVWNQVITSMFALVEKRQTEAPRSQDRVREVLLAYLADVKLYAEAQWSESLGEGYPFHRRGMVWVNKRQLLKWLKVNSGTPFTEGDIESGFHLLGMVRERHEGIDRSGKVRRPWCWGIAMDAISDGMPTNAPKSAKKSD